MTSKKGIMQLREKYRKLGFKMAMNEAAKTKPKKAKAEQIIDFYKGLDFIRNSILVILQNDLVSVVQSEVVRKLKSVYTQYFTATSSSLKTIEELTLKIEQGEILSDSQFEAAARALDDISKGIRKVEPLAIRAFEIIHKANEKYLTNGIKQTKTAWK